MKLLREGLKLAVLGVDIDGDWRFWHVIRAGTIEPFEDSKGLKHGIPLCSDALGIPRVVTNGYPPDFTPPDGSLCPACNERKA